MAAPHSGCREYRLQPLAAFTASVPGPVARQGTGDSPSRLGREGFGPQYHWLQRRLPDLASVPRDTGAQSLALAAPRPGTATDVGVAGPGPDLVGSRLPNSAGPCVYVCVRACVRACVRE